MNDKKYYTPTIEEFHVGFEFEIKCFYDGSEFEPFIQDNLEPPMISHGSGFCPFEHALSEGHIRVKLLDREDIESLGLKFIGCELEEDRRTCKFPIIYEVRKRDTDNIFDLGKAEITLVNISENIYNLTNYKLNPARKISGAFIKNKSELKRLMKQLGI